MSAKTIAYQLILSGSDRQPWACHLLAVVFALSAFVGYSRGSWFGFGFSVACAALNEGMAMRKPETP